MVSMEPLGLVLRKDYIAVRSKIIRASVIRGQFRFVSSAGNFHYVPIYIHVYTYIYINMQVYIYIYVYTCV